MAPLLGISLMPHDDFCQAIQPLFEAHLVEVIEWSFDMGWGRTLPHWCEEVLDVYSECDRLLGHGVHYSLLSAQWDSSQWLACLKMDCHQYRYRHITEHFGWMVAGGFSQGTPLPLPMTSTTVAMGQKRLQRLADVAQVPVGLENLAFAFHRQDVLTQGAFLTELLAPINGFILLDLHNLYCQMNNFGLSAEEILETYPLDQVREIHLSGGSWSELNGKRVRRDTHDQAIPEVVFELLAIALERCPHVEVVIVERLGHTLTTEFEQRQFQAQFRRIHAIVDDPSRQHSELDGDILSDARQSPHAEPDISIDALAIFQSTLLSALHSSENINDAQLRLHQNQGNEYLEAYISQAEPAMLQLSQHLVKKWGQLNR